MKVNRTLLHFPIGLVTVALIYANIGLGVLFGSGFIIYEITQGEDPHLDIKGFLWGLGTTGVLLLIIQELL